MCRMSTMGMDIEQIKMIGEEEVVNFRDLYNFLKKERAAEMITEDKQLDLVLVPLGMGVLLAYHVWLLFTIRRNPRRTVIGLNAESRHKWVFCLMAVSILHFTSPLLLLIFTFVCLYVIILQIVAKNFC
ncbi:hypothetical protein Pfo_020420 [Paulownia fortunei]|nr:hypothetical protein Pfo_020420 [Paulownia fortunei]